MTLFTSISKQVIEIISTYKWWQGRGNNPAYNKVISIKNILGQHIIKD
jgi:hypothetical protein